MRIMKRVSRTKKRAHALYAKHPRLALAGLGVVFAVTGAAAVSMFRATSAPAPTASTLSTQRAAENKRAQAELAAPAADYAAAASSGESHPAVKTPPVTLTGCLEQHGDDFRLKDASGADVPRSRSWKSGFLKKGTPALDVVDASKRLKLKDHVGERVSVTGVLVDREMQAKGLKGVSSSCN